MKKLIQFIILLVGIVVMVSCSDSDSNATCTYYVGTDSIVYADSLEKVTYDSLVMSEIVSLKLTSYSFTEKGVAENGITSFAVQACDINALNTFQKKYVTVPSLDEVCNNLFSKNSQFFAEKGITSADAIDLHPFSVYLSLWNFTYNYNMQSTKIDIR